MTKLRRTWFCIASFLVLILGFWMIPIPSLDMEYSKILYDDEGRLLSASIAKDEQWRFPLPTELPKPYKDCVLHFEDEYFYYHPGVNPASILKALKQNVSNGKIIRGGSTLSMQVMRMFRGNRSRTIKQKCIEILGAIKLEWLYPKQEILHIWSSLAPFGGNTVGAQSAAIRYFDRNLDQLSWAEYATLAVLPNAPASIHLNRNKQALLNKRNSLLKKLKNDKIIDEETYQLALTENLPSYNPKIDQNAFHLLQYLTKKHPNLSSYQSTINRQTQLNTASILQDFAAQYQTDGIKNISAIVIDNMSNEVISYVGNVQYNNAIQYVDCAQGQRSFGSLLKPILYAYAIEKGYFLPEEMVKDIPTSIGGFTPKNFDRSFRGMVPFSEMVSKSLNIPAIRTLNYVGLASFHDHLYSDFKLKSIHPDPNHHGLSLILGGAEASLWELARLYHGLIRNHYELSSPYDYPHVLRQDSTTMSTSFRYHPITLWHTFHAMKTLNRPPEEQKYQKYGGREIAWKTGTSYGHRDAWAIGIDKDYTVAIWVGNETGEGRHELTGVKKAAPILFRVFRSLPKKSNFSENMTQAESVKVCLESGMLKGRMCSQSKSIFNHSISHKLRTCNRHTVTKSNDTLFTMNHVSNYYFNKFHGLEQNTISQEQSIQIIYPENHSILQIPKKLDQEFAQVNATVHSTNQNATLYWFLDDEFIDKTTNKHNLSLSLSPGTHHLFVNDTIGHSSTIHFEVVRRDLN